MARLKCFLRRTYTTPSRIRLGGDSNGTGVALSTGRPPIGRKSSIGNRIAIRLHTLSRNLQSIGASTLSAPLVPPCRQAPHYRRLAASYYGADREIQR